MASITLLGKDVPDIENLLSLNPKIKPFAKFCPRRILLKIRKCGREILTKTVLNVTSNKKFDDIKHTTLSERSALKEAARCLKCTDAPCQKSCSNATGY